MNWDADGLEAFLAGSMLRARLPGLGWDWDLYNEGIVVRQIDHHTLKPHDVIHRKFTDMQTFGEFQEFLDEITLIVTDSILADPPRLKTIQEMRQEGRG